MGWWERGRVLGEENGLRDLEREFEAGMLGRDGIVLLWICRWYFAKVCKAPKLYACEGVLKELLKDGVSNLWKPYHPTPWLVFSHLQTVAGGVKSVGQELFS